MTFLAPRAAFTVVLMAFATACVPANAGAMPTIAGGTSVSSLVVQVHQDWRHGDRRWHRDDHVHAPFTHVETRRGRSTEVHAPFAAVRSERRGVWVRAPFVNLYVPR